nr:hypothetical protein [Saprospiraceae bacterium]
DNKLTFFTGANNQKGLWTKKTIWRKMGNSNSHQLADQSRNILVFRDNKSWGRSTDFEEVLDALDHPYDQMNSSSMQHVDLKRYDMVIVPGGQKDEFYQNYETQGDKFDLFVEKGGTLILELNGAEGVLSVLTGGVRIIPNKAIENEIIEPGHPIFRPLAGARFFEARYASMSYFQNVPSGAIALAVESEAGNSIEGRPTFLEYTHGRGKVFAASQCFHDRDGSGRGPLKESVISYALMEMAGL